LQRFNAPSPSYETLRTSEKKTFLAGIVIDVDRYGRPGHADVQNHHRNERGKLD